jgi:hypothetical protein
MNQIKQKQAGFTIIELSIAMSFVALLLLVIAATTVQVANIYSKGLTLKTINQSGRFLSTELERNIAASAPFDVTNPNDFYRRFRTTTTGGRLCLGRYSYIWNYGDAINANNVNTNKYFNSNQTIRFVKVEDLTSNNCVNYNHTIDFTKSTELLDSSQSANIVIHDFRISTSASGVDTKTSQRLYYIDFLIGTNELDTLTAPALRQNIDCQPPSNIASNFSFCAVGMFSIIARAGDTIE